MIIPNICKNNTNVPIIGTFSGNPVLITGGYLTSTECSRQSLTQVGMYVDGTRLLGLYDIATTLWDFVSVKFWGFPLSENEQFSEIHSPFTIVFNVNPGLINHGLLIKGVLPK